jgi:integrase
MPAEKSTKKVRLNKTNVEALPVPPKDHAPVLYWDDLLTGFYVQISDRGTRTYYAYGRMPNGRQSRKKIGRHGALMAEQARARAKQLLGRIAGGDDPAAESRAARQAEKERREAPTVAELCARYLAEHVDVHNKSRTRAENRRMVEQIIKPRISRLKVEAVDHEDVVRLHRDLKGTPRQANHVVAILSKMFNLAEVWKDGSGRKLRPLNSNPCRHVQRYPETKRERFLSADELERVGTVLRDLEAAEAIRPEIAACIRFLALTGCRLGEAVGATWGTIDAKAGVWRLADAKAGARNVALGAPALALLARLVRSGDHVFVSADGAPVTTNVIERAWIGEKAQPKHRKAARPGIRGRAGIPDARIHDLRHGYGTFAGSAGLNAFMVRDLLGHKTITMAGRYVSRNADPMRQAADVVSGQIAAALDGPKAEVVALRPAGTK